MDRETDREPLRLRRLARAAPRGGVTDLEAEREMDRRDLYGLRLGDRLEVRLGLRESWERARRRGGVRDLDTDRSAGVRDRDRDRL